MVAALPENVQPNVTIHEPATLLTDCLLAAFSGWLAWRLRQPRTAGSAANQWLSRALGLTALSALVGGSYHGFAPNFSAPLANLWWIATLLIINLLSAAMALSLLHEILPADRHRPWSGLIAFKFAAFAGAATTHPHFVVVIIDYGLAMLAWAIAALLMRRPWSSRMLAGISLSVVAALIQQMGWAPSRHFNHNDLYHVIQALALICIYGAARKFTAGTPFTSPSAPKSPGSTS